MCVCYVGIDVCVCICVCAYNYICISRMLLLQGGEDSQDPLSCRSFSTKEPQNIGLFCGK